MTMWNPWRGCRKYSEGCVNCYIHRGDKKRNIDTNNITKTTSFTKPIEKNKNGTYKIKSGLVYLCFSSDFLIEEADPWRDECWHMIKKRSDLDFLFLTKRIERLTKCLPVDWKDGYENVTIGCSIENQKNADYKLAIFQKLPIKHKMIIVQPLLEHINIEKYLDNIELVVVGGESAFPARQFNYDWALSLRTQCQNQNINFEFRQCGNNFIKDGKHYSLKTKELISQAKKANINYSAK